MIQKDLYREFDFSGFNHSENVDRGTHYSYINCVYEYLPFYSSHLIKKSISRSDSENVSTHQLIVNKSDVEFKKTVNEKTVIYLQFKHTSLEEILESLELISRNFDGYEIIMIYEYLISNFSIKH
jgi:nicotinamidase-related amidase